MTFSSSDLILMTTQGDYYYYPAFMDRKKNQCLGWFSKLFKVEQGVGSIRAAFEKVMGSMVQVCGDQSMWQLNSPNILMRCG
jgi:hypothetical protein